MNKFVACSLVGLVALVALASASGYGQQQQMQMQSGYGANNMGGYGGQQMSMGGYGGQQMSMGGHGANMGGYGGQQMSMGGYGGQSQGQNYERKTGFKTLIYHPYGGVSNRFDYRTFPAYSGSGYGGESHPAPYIKTGLEYSIQDGGYGGQQNSY